MTVQSFCFARFHYYYVTCFVICSHSKVVGRKDPKLHHTETWTPRKHKSLSDCFFRRQGFKRLLIQLSSLVFENRLLPEFRSDALQFPLRAWYRYRTRFFTTTTDDLISYPRKTSLRTQTYFRLSLVSPKITSANSSQRLISVTSKLLFCF